MFPSKILYIDADVCLLSLIYATSTHKTYIIYVYIYMTVLFNPCVHIYIYYNYIIYYIIIYIYIIYFNIIYIIYFYIIYIYNYIYYYIYIYHNRFHLFSQPTLTMFFSSWKPGYPDFTRHPECMECDLARSEVVNQWKDPGRCWKAEATIFHGAFVVEKEWMNPLEPQTNNQLKMGWKWWFPTISYVKIGNLPIETGIYKWLFGVPGLSVSL